MQYTVVHSNNPYLLARLATDLQMYGDLFKYFCGNPFYRETGIDKNNGWMCIYDTYEFGFYNHDCYDPIEIRHELTSRNYIKVLTQILS